MKADKMGRNIGERQQKLHCFPLQFICVTIMIETYWIWLGESNVIFSNHSATKWWNAME